MKKIISIFIVVFIFGIVSHAQNQVADLEGINYQAVAIDEDGKEIVGADIDGKPLYEKQIAVRFTIDNGPSGSVDYYQDEHVTNTDKYGLFSLTIGRGINTGIGDHTSLMDIPWINGDQWLKVEISTENDGDFRVVSHEKFMAVPFAYYTDDIADNSITTHKIVDETILAEDIATGAVETSEILNETILAEDIATGAVETDEILNETILAEDIATGAVESDEILNETIIAEDIATGAVESDEILNETIIAEDIATGAVESDEILNETILAEDIATGAVESDEILNETILAEDIATGAVESDEILNETIIAEDIATGAVESDEILDGSVQNQDIADGTINLSTKVTDILPVENGGTGIDGSTVTDGQLLIGNGTNGDFDPANITSGTGIIITNTPGGIEISSGVQGVNSSVAGNVNPNQINDGDTWISPAIPLSGVAFGNIIVGSINTSLQGCQMTAYVTSSNIIKVSIFNGTGNDVNLGNGLELRVLVVQ